MHAAQVEQEARALLETITRRQPGVRSGSSFAVNVDDLGKASASEARSDAALQWLLDKELLERDKENEERLRHVKGIPDRLYKLTEKGQRWV